MSMIKVEEPVLNCSLIDKICISLFFFIIIYFYVYVHISVILNYFFFVKACLNMSFIRIYLYLKTCEVVEKDVKVMILLIDC